MTNLVCEFCGSRFRSTKRQRFCSRACYILGYQKDSIVKPIPEDRTGNCPYNDGLLCDTRNCTRCGFYPPVEKERKEKLEQQYGIRWVAE